MFNTKFTANIKPASIHDVAKKMQLSGFSGEHFKDNAKSALIKAGYQKAAADRILNGQKLETKDLKKVFATLRRGKVITMDSSAVTSFVKQETNRQKGIYSLNTRQRADEIEKEKQAEKVTANKKDVTEKKKVSPALNTSSSVSFLGQKVELMHSEAKTISDKKMLIPAESLSDSNLNNKPDVEIELMRQSAEDNDMEIG